MAFRVTLLPVRAGSNAVGPNALAAAYLQYCERVFEAQLRPQKTEAQALTWVREERKRGGAVFWLADLRGEVWTTEEFAGRVGRLRDAGSRHLILGVGPANGWAAEARAVADLRLSLSAMTLPHELAALLLAEQIYRVSTILRGHPYHLGH